MHLAMRLHLAAAAAKKAKKAKKPIPDAKNVEETPDYAELADGKFRCLHCGHTLGTETGIINHVEDKHQGRVIDDGYKSK